MNEFLQVPDFEAVFALGDIAYNMQPSGRPTPALAQAAVQEAKCVAGNIFRHREGKPLRPFLFRQKGNLVSLGQWMAAGEIWGLALIGHLTWLLWRSVYVSKMISWEDKFKVALDWMLNILSPRDTSYYNTENTEQDNAGE